MRLFTSETVADCSYLECQNCNSHRKSIYSLPNWLKIMIDQNNFIDENSMLNIVNEIRQNKPDPIEIAWISN